MGGGQDSWLAGAQWCSGLKGGCWPSLPALQAKQCSLSPGVIHMIVMKMVMPVAKLASGVLALHKAGWGGVGRWEFKASRRHAVLTCSSSASWAWPATQR